jgi:hypothetical protein
MKARYQNALLILLTCSLAANLALYFLLHPVIYDGLRHFLFLLPILASLAALSATALLTSKMGPWMRALVLVPILLNMVLTISHLVRLHPYEYVYFNELTGGLKGAQGRFETDYWDASVKEALEWIEKEVPSNGQTMTVSSYGSAWQALFYTPSNLTWTNDKKKADHYIATTRDDRHNMPKGSDPVHTVEREGVPLSYVFRLK